MYFDVLFAHIYIWNFFTFNFDPNAINSEMLHQNVNLFPHFWNVHKTAYLTYMQVFFISISGLNKQNIFLKIYSSKTYN